MACFQKISIAQLSCILNFLIFYIRTCLDIPGTYTRYVAYVMVYQGYQYVAGTRSFHIAISYCNSQVEIQTAEQLQIFIHMCNACRSWRDGDVKGYLWCKMYLLLSTAGMTTLTTKIAEIPLLSLPSPSFPFLPCRTLFLLHEFEITFSMVLRYSYEVGVNLSCPFRRWYSAYQYHINIVSISYQYHINISDCY